MGVKKTSWEEEKYSSEAVYLAAIYCPLQEGRVEKREEGHRKISLNEAHLSPITGSHITHTAQEENT